MPRTKRNPDLTRRIGARIRALRIGAGLTQERLAWDAGIDKGYLWHVEAGQTLPSVAVLALLAERLGVHLVDVVAASAEDPRTELLDAVRAGDAEAAIASLLRLGVLVAPPTHD